MKIETMWVAYRNEEGEVVCHETSPTEIADYCLDVGLPQWVGCDPQFFTEEHEARQAESDLKERKDL